MARQRLPIARISEIAMEDKNRGGPTDLITPLIRGFWWWIAGVPEKQIKRYPPTSN